MTRSTVSNDKSGQSLSREFHRNAGAVLYDSDSNRKIFKLPYLNVVLSGVRKSYNRLKNALISTTDWNTSAKKAATWVLNTALEGTVANFATHTLFGWPFTMTTAIAYGLIIYESLDIVERLRARGASPKIPDEKE